MNWTVRAKDKHNNIIKLKIESLDKENLKNNLKMLDYYPLRIERDYSIFGKKRLSNRIIIDFLEEWTSLEKVNINTQYALTIIKDNTSHKKLKDVLSIILFDINSGKTIEEAFNNCKSYFPDLFITNIIIGYKKGDLLSNLEMIKDYYSESFKTKEQVKRSLTYPKIVILLMFVVLFVIGKFIIPTYNTLFQQSGMKINTTTKLVINFFMFLGDHVFQIILLLLILISLIYLLLKIRGIRYLFDSLKYKIPFVATYQRIFVTYIFTTSLNLLWQSGYNKYESFEIIMNSFKNLFIRDKIRTISEEVKSGIFVSDAIKKSNIFEQNFVNTITVGEKTNTIQSSIETSAKYYHFKYNNFIKKLVTYIEPMFILFMGAIIVLIMIAIFVPMISIIKVVN